VQWDLAVAGAVGRKARERRQRATRSPGTPTSATIMKPDHSSLIVRGPRACFGARASAGNYLLRFVRSAVTMVSRHASRTGSRSGWVAAMIILKTRRNRALTSVRRCIQRRLKSPTMGDATKATSRRNSFGSKADAPVTEDGVVFVHAAGKGTLL
jgi:hypothetical protein